MNSNDFVPDGQPQPHCPYPTDTIVSNGLNLIGPGHIDPEMIKEVPSVVQDAIGSSCKMLAGAHHIVFQKQNDKIDEVERNAKAAANVVLEEARKFAAEVDPYNLDKFCRITNHILCIFTVNNTKYTWNGWFGAIFESEELKPVDKGTVRLICGMPFYVLSCEKLWGWKLLHRKTTYRICWTAPNREMEWIRDLKKCIFGAE